MSFYGCLDSLKCSLAVSHPLQNKSYLCNTDWIPAASPLCSLITIIINKTRLMELIGFVNYPSIS